MLPSMEVDMADAKYITPRQAETFFRISVRYLSVLRGRGDGPPFVKIGKKILYSITDFESWLNSKKLSKRQLKQKTRAIRMTDG
jgi:hypothetical protein